MEIPAIRQHQKGITVEKSRLGGWIGVNSPIFNKDKPSEPTHSPLQENWLSEG